jgi:hypothetical protein
VKREAPAMTRGAAQAIIGRWRIVEMALWDRDFLDLVEPAYIAFNIGGLGEFAFGAVTGDIDYRIAAGEVRFTWRGYDEGDEQSEDGIAELEQDGTLSGEIRFHLGDDSTFKARRG